MLSSRQLVYLELHTIPKCFTGTPYGTSPGHPDQESVINIPYFLHLTQLVVTQMKFLQSCPSVDWSTQIQAFDAVLTEHQLSDITGRPASRAGQNSNAVGPHVH